MVKPGGRMMPSSPPPKVLAATYPNAEINATTPQAQSGILREFGRRVSELSGMGVFLGGIISFSRFEVCPRALPKARRNLTLPTPVLTEERAEAAPALSRISVTGVSPLLIFPESFALRSK